MRRLIVAITFLLTGLGLLFFAQSKASILNFMVVEGAYDIREYRSKDGGRLQISYNVNLDYPAFAVTGAYYEQLKQRGWVECTGTKNDWDSYPDMSGNHGKTVHQYIKAWSKSTQLLTIIMLYHSVLRIDSKSSGPDNNIQNVILLLDKYDELSTTREVQQRLGISCDAKVSS